MFLPFVRLFTVCFGTVTQDDGGDMEESMGDHAKSDMDRSLI